jgi:fluoroacetyl-CoA thioesterase
VKASLQSGLTADMTCTVAEDMSPPHLPVKVLSTPAMIGLIERTCFACVQPHLDDTETTVGTHVNVSHTGSVRAGEGIKVDARLTDVNKRRLLFRVEVTGPRGSVSTGTHERAVIDLDRMRSRNAG